MRKKFFIKSVALVVCLVIIGISASGLLAAEKRTAKVDARLLFQRPIEFLISVFPALNSFLNFENKAGLIGNSSDSSEIVKPTGRLVTGRPSDED